MLDSEWIDIKHFKPEDFELNAPKGSSFHMNKTLVFLLDKACEESDIKFRITKGYEEPREDATAPGELAHTKGTAVDIFVKEPRAKFAILSALMGAGFSYFIVDEYHIHIEYDPSDSKREGFLVRCLDCKRC